MKGAIANYPTAGKLLMLLGLFLVGETLFSLAALYITDALIPAADIIGLTTTMSDYTSATEFSAAQVSALKLFQLLSSIGRFICVPFIFLYLNNSAVVAYTGLNKKISLRQVILICAIMLSSTAIISFLQEWNQSLHLPAIWSDTEEAMRKLETQAQLQTDAFLNTTTLSGLLINIFIIGIVASVGEELLFRGVLQRVIHTQTGRLHLAVWSSAFVFSFIHLQFLGFFPRLVLGAVVGYIYAWSGNLWTAILAHFVNNTGAVITYFLLNKGIIAEEFGEPSGWLQALLSLPLFIFFVLLYYRSTENGKRLDDNLHNYRADKSMDYEGGSGE